MLKFLLTLLKLPFTLFSFFYDFIASRLTKKYLKIIFALSFIWVFKVLTCSYLKNNGQFYTPENFIYTYFAIYFFIYFFYRLFYEDSRNLFFKYLILIYIRLCYWHKMGPKELFIKNYNKFLLFLEKINNSWWWKLIKVAVFNTFLFIKKKFPFLKNKNYKFKDDDYKNFF